MRRAHLALAALLLVGAQAGCVSAKRQQQANGRLELGAAYLNEGKPEAAIEELRTAVKADPGNWAAWEKLGLAYMARGALDESERAFKRAVRLQPKNAQVLNNYGLLLMRMERLDDAIEQFERAEEDLTYRKTALVLSNLGYALYLKGDYDRAIAKLDDAIRRSPELCPAWFHRGLAWQGKGKPDRALADLQTVIDKCGDEAPGAWYHGALVLESMGETDRARIWLLEVQRIAPNTDVASAAGDALARVKGP